MTTLVQISIFNWVEFVLLFSLIISFINIIYLVFHFMYKYIFVWINFFLDNHFQFITNIIYKPSWGLCKCDREKKWNTKKQMRICYIEIQPKTTKLQVLQARFDWACSWTVVENAKLSSTPPSTGLSRIQHL